MSFPLGNKSVAINQKGNALLVLRSRQGNIVRRFLWINQIATDLNLQITEAQLRSRVGHVPIRLAERELIFTTLWAVRSEQQGAGGFLAYTRNDYEELVARIRDHWAYSLDLNVPVPMKLLYYGANKSFLGHIEGSQMTYNWNDVVLSFSFTMRLINSPNISYDSLIGGAPFVPTSSFVKNWGPGWYTVSQLDALVTGVANEYPSVPVPFSGPPTPSNKPPLP